MLYDRKWDGAKHPSMEGLAAWLRQQDPDAKYDWLSCSQCMVAQYMNWCGVDVKYRLLSSIFPSKQTYQYVGVGTVRETMNIEEFVRLHSHQWTFGQALTRLESVLCGEKVFA